MSADLRLRLMPFEQVSEGIRLYDASEVVRAQYPRRASAKAKRPADAEICALFVHHSGALGQPGLGGLLAAVRYVMTQRKPPFPGPPYHLWAPHAPVRDDEGHLVLFRAAEDEHRCWHTGGKANDIGIGLALQGNLTRTGPSPSQVEILEAIVPWFAERHGLAWEDIRAWLGWHAIAGRWGGHPKAACPGKATERWLVEYLARATA